MKARVLIEILSRNPDADVIITVPEHWCGRALAARFVSDAAKKPCGGGYSTDFSVNVSDVEKPDDAYPTFFLEELP